jgi:hypothetical protein
MQTNQQDKIKQSLSPIPDQTWSVDIYTGNSPLSLKPSTHTTLPTISWPDITDVPANLVADPFMVKEGECWYMFVEIKNRVSRKGEIALATSEDGINWEYQQVVLAEPYHLSYPYVFKWQGCYYMVPETLGAEAIQLYRADSFPYNWQSVSRLVEGTYADPCLFRHQGRWWLLACAKPYQHDTLCLFYADSVTGPYQVHPGNPVVTNNKKIARPGGRVFSYNGKLLRYAQDCQDSYGSQVRVLEITELTPQTYRQQELAESPILTASGVGWNMSGMHHVDPHQLADGSWIACVDGVGQVPKACIDKKEGLPD